MAAGVRVARSDRSAAPIDTAAASTTSTPDDSVPDSQPVHVGTVDWRACKDEAAPWQCGTISVPMDYTKPTGREITIALDRLPAAKSSQRVGSLVLNPGGPGGSGINLAYNSAASMPQQILDRFDIVGFDPRGVGASTGVSCNGDVTPGSSSLRQCIASTGDYLSYLGTPNVARDLDMIRAAIGDAKLSYLGYSYGTALGGVYADMFPGHIRALVLDGSVDPAAGKVNTTKHYGDDFYAEQDFDGTVAIFVKLCDATTDCALGPDAQAMLDKVRGDVAKLPVAYFSGTKSVSASDLDDIIVESMYTVDDWPFLAIALNDAAKGDASTLAAFASYMEYGYPAVMEAEPNFDYANLAIRCADFAGRGSASSDCSDFPPTAEPIPAITTANGAPPIVVVGTRGDPATPWHYSHEMAAALGSGAVSITWEGAGHTAFGTSQCITDLVTKYLVDLTVPADKADCPFVTGATTTAEQADTIFSTLGTHAQMGLLDDTLEAADGLTPSQAECVGQAILAHHDARLTVHELLGVESPDLTRPRSQAEHDCT
ncbi:MAG: putative tripeptidylaminopeptidase [Ilumatobacteraceae bacterium]|nr:putative tripeptidylaminopeptidase [Ilumatobacteraceae bacterium]